MESPVQGRPGPMRSPLVLPEGIEAGLVGAVSVAAVFFLRDFWIGDPMRTPAVLGTLLLEGATVVRTQGPVEGAAVVYHAFHFIAWTVLGFVGAALMAHVERTRARWLLPITVLLALLPLVAFDAYTATAQIERLHLWIGGLTGIVAMGAFLAWRHPDALRRSPVAG